MVEAIAGKACPHLGRCDDPGSYYAFPTDANCCYSEQRGVAVAPSFQSTACLAEGWKACPRYQAALDRSLAPAGPAAPKGTLRIFGLPWLAIAAAVAGIVLLVVLLVLPPKSKVPEVTLATSTPTAAQGTAVEVAHLTATQAAGRTSAPEGTERPPTASPRPSATQASTATPSVTATVAPSLTPTPTDTPTPTSSPTATRTPTRTPSPTSTRTPSATPTRTPSPKPTTARTATPRPTRRPTATKPAATSTPLPAPILVSPASGLTFFASDEILLRWRPGVALPPNAYYDISVAYSHQGLTWYDEIPWTQGTSWALSDHDYLPDLSDDGYFHWSVQIVGGTGVPLSASSDVWSLIWRRKGEVTPPPPPP